MENSNCSFAIVVRGAVKQYSPKGLRILDNLDMTVKKGVIYGLLGASGCGKTTLLSSIVGIKQLQSGNISIFGQSPGKAAVKTIGYMPQDISLMGEFSVKGAVQHYGWIFGMKNKKIDERFEFLRVLLDLPPPHTLVKHLSGGQQRRVSLAVVLIHDPKLLILDEPTVGLDPVLRQNIWEYLVKITDLEKKTVVITTHYIEEATRAHQIGLMRRGKLMDEGEPQSLMEKYNCSMIEDVFLHLSMKQQDELLKVPANESEHKIKKQEMQGALSSKNELSKSFFSHLCFTNRGHAQALLSKNFLRFKRHPGTILYAFFFPALQLCTFFWSTGVVPNGVKLGIVNEELGNYTNCIEYQANNRIGGSIQDNETCVYSGLGCRFVENLSQKLQTVVYYKTLDEAIEATKKGKIHNFVHFPRNFSDAVTITRNHTIDFTDSDLDFRIINIYRDIVDRALSDVMLRELFTTYKKYAETLAIDCNTNPHAERIPIKFEDPPYGSDDLTYRDYIAPGALGLIAVFVAMSISTSAITMERTEGIWERTLVCGVTPTEILIFHSITLSAIAIVQILELFIIAFNMFGLVCHGDKVTIFSLIYIQSIAGICFGIFISVITKTVNDANYASLGLFYPFITLTGCFWPLEGMPTILRYISYFVPLTVTSQSLAYVIHRGWSFSQYKVFKAYLASFGFIGFFTLLSAIILRREKK